MDSTGTLRKPRVNAIEYMRGISMLGVVGIHVGSQYIVNNTVANMHLVAVFEIVTRFSVPIFFFISAFGLFYNLDWDKKLNYGKFIRKRFETVVVPYLAWSVFYLLLYGSHYDNMAVFKPIHVLFVLFFGLACYQLYFMVILIWFYLLMPLWIFIVKRMDYSRLTVMFVLQIIFDYYSSFVMNPYGITNSLLRDLLVYRLNYWVLHYIFIFIIGGYIAVHFKEFQLFMKNKRAEIAVFFLLSLIGILAYYYYCLFGKGYTLLEAINTAHQLSPAGVFYTLGATIFLFSEFYHADRVKLVKNIFSPLGKHSYFAYLCHPVFISLLAAILGRLNLMMTGFISIVFYCGTVFLAVLAAIICRNFSEKYFPYLNALTIGKYPRHK